MGKGLRVQLGEEGEGADPTNQQREIVDGKV